MVLSQDFYKKNRIQFSEKMCKNSIALFYSGRPVQMSYDAEYPFYPSNNFYYLTGIRESQVVLLIYKNDTGATTELLFIEKNDPLKVKWVGKKLEIAEARYLSGIKEVKYKENLKDILLSQNTIEYLYFDNSVPKHQSFSIEEDEVKKAMVNLNLMDASKILEEMRIIKKDEEIEMIKKAIVITKIGLFEMMKCTKNGANERHLQAAFEYAIAMAGSDSVAFDTIIAGGKSATTLHYTKNNMPLQGGDLVLLDFGARTKGYCGDISRTIPVNGKYTGNGRKVYQAVLNAQKEIIKLYKVDTPINEIQEKAKVLLYEECKRADLPLKEDSIEQVYYHGIGHSLGLDTHDTYDKRDLVLKEGMVVTCEPGLYFEELGIGVRIEDDILISKDAPINLSKEIPKEIEEIQEIMRLSI